MGTLGCKGCLIRHPLCHMSCDVYLSYVAGQNRKKELIAMGKRMEHEADEFKILQSIKVKRGRG